MAQELPFIDMLIHQLYKSALVYFISQMLMVLLKMAIYYRVLFVQLLPHLLDIVMC